jgi:ATP-binding cassette subfamily B protein
MCSGLRAYLFTIMSERISKNLRHDFFESMINKDVAFFDERRTGDLRKSI